MRVGHAMAGECGARRSVGGYPGHGASLEKSARRCASDPITRTGLAGSHRNTVSKPSALLGSCDPLGYDVARTTGVGSACITGVPESGAINTIFTLSSGARTYANAASFPNVTEPSTFVKSSGFDGEVLRR